MCGLAGVMGRKLTLGDITKFKDMFTFAQVRGEDGAGVLTIPDTLEKIDPKDIKVRRTTWSSGHLVTTSDFVETVKSDVSVVLGHARQPTKGGTKIENVHPHRNGDVYLVHNGTMTFVDGVQVKDTESDSRLICKAIQMKGIDGFVQDSFGAYCLIWVDLRDQTLNFLRNSQRPLWIADEHYTSQQGSAVSRVWWASEAWMIATALSRYQGYNKDRMNFYQLPENSMFSYPLDMSSLSPKIRTVEKKHGNTSHYHGTHWFRDWDDDVTAPFDATKGTNATTSGSTTTNTKSTVVTKTEKFSYTPPEHRSSSAINAAHVFDKSKADALHAANLRKILQAQEGGSAASSSKFPFEYWRCKDIHRIKKFIDAANCVWCSSTPVFVVSGEGRTEAPAIYPVRFAEDRKDYVCVECIQHLDVQKMVGVTAP